MNKNKKLVAFVLGVTLTLLRSAHADVKAEAIDDKTITENVKEALADDSKLNSDDIDVSTDAGVVKLLGDVGTESEYSRAFQDCVVIAGVRAVANMLEVREAAPD